MVSVKTFFSFSALTMVETLGLSSHAASSLHIFLMSLRTQKIDFAPFETKRKLFKMF